MDLGQEVVTQGQSLVYEVLTQFHGDQTWLVGQMWVGINNNPVIYAWNHDFVHVFGTI